MKDLKTLVGKTFEDKGFVSTSYDREKNVFTSMPVLMEVLVPENSNLYITTNIDESEVILERNSKFEILDISIENKIWSEYDDGKKNKIVMKILKTE